MTEHKQPSPDIGQSVSDAQLEAAFEAFKTSIASSPKEMVRAALEAAERLRAQSSATQPIAWLYEATEYADKTYEAGWKRLVSLEKPFDRTGGIRNITPLYAVITKEAST